MDITHVTAPAPSADLQTEMDSERQAYLDEAHVESTQFGVGRWDAMNDAD